MSLLLIGQVIGFALASVIFSEGLSTFFVYRKEDYRRLANQINKFRDQLDAQKKIDSEAAPTNTSTATTGKANKSKNAKKTGRIEEQLKYLSTQIAGFNMRVALINMVILLSAYMLIGQAFEGIVVARLPFEPYAFFQGLTHRTLEGEDFREASAHLIFALSLVLCRQIVQKLMELYGVRPPQPRQLSVWEMASEEAEKVASKIN